MMSLLNLVSMMAALATSACALSSSLTVQPPAPVVVDASELYQEQTLLYHWFHEASGIAVLDSAGTTLNRISSGARMIEGSNPPAYLVSEGKNPSSFRPMHPHSSPVPSKHPGALVARDLRTNDELWRIELGADARVRTSYAIGDFWTLRYQHRGAVDLVVDGKTGSVLWKGGARLCDPMVRTPSRLLAHDCDVYEIVAWNPSIQDFDWRAAAPEWAKRSSDSSLLEVQGELVVASLQQGPVLGLSLQTGKRLWSWEPGKGRQVVALAVSTDWVWVLTDAMPFELEMEGYLSLAGPQENTPNTARLHRLSRKTGKAKRISLGTPEPVGHEVGGWVRVYTAPKELVVLNLGDGVMRAVDPDSAEPLWSYGIGVWPAPVQVELRGHAFLAWVGFKPGVGEKEQSFIQWLSLEEPPQAQRELHIHGHVRGRGSLNPVPHAPVAVGGVVTSTDENGYYSVRLQMSGSRLLVGTMFSERDCRDDRVWWNGLYGVEAAYIGDGGSDYEVDIEATYDDPCTYVD